MHSQKAAEGVQKVSVLRITEESRSTTDDLVAVEFPLTIFLDNRELVTVLCSPLNLKYLAVGFLLSEGFLKAREQINKIVLDGAKGVVWVETKNPGEIDFELPRKRFITSGCGRGASFYSFSDLQGSARVESEMQVSSSQVFELISAFQHGSEVYRTTHGVHSAALCDTKRILVFSEDIGRHNALDKIFGECILNDIQMNDRMIVVSGRISSEMLLKVARRNIPVVASVAAPTSIGIKLAEELGVTLIGLVRGKKMNVYAGAQRVVD